MCVKITMRFFTFWTAFDFKFFVVIKKYHFPHSTDCFEKYHFSMTKKSRWTCGFEKCLKLHENSLYYGENGLVILIVFFLGHLLHGSFN